MHSAPLNDPKFDLAPQPAYAPFVPFEQQLSRDLEHAMTEGSLYFEDRGKVQESLSRIAARLNESQIPYAIAGGMCLYAHGVRRFTEDVDILVTREGLEQIHRELQGRGYVTPFAKSKNLRDSDTGVRIEFLIAGQFPGDGKPKPVAFPDPATAREELSGRWFLTLPKLVELKLASGISSPHRGKDLVDVQQIIEALQLPADFQDELNPYVRAKFSELWSLVNEPQRFVYLLEGASLPPGASSLDEALAHLGPEFPQLYQMHADGVQLDESRGGPGEVWLFTTERRVADKYGFQREDEFLA